MEAGIKNEKSIVVTEDVTASKVGSGLLTGRRRRHSWCIC